MANYDVGEIQIPHKIFGSERICRDKAHTDTGELLWGLLTRKTEY